MEYYDYGFTSKDITTERREEAQREYKRLFAVMQAAEERAKPGSIVATRGIEHMRGVLARYDYLIRLCEAHGV